MHNSTELCTYTPLFFVNIFFFLFIFFTFLKNPMAGNKVSCNNSVDTIPFTSKNNMRHYKMCHCMLWEYKNNRPVFLIAPVA